MHLTYLDVKKEVANLKSTSHLKYFQKKTMIVVANLLSKLQSVKVLLRPLCKKCRVRTPFGTQHVKGSQKRQKSE